LRKVIGENSTSVDKTRLELAKARNRKDRNEQNKWVIFSFLDIHQNTIDGWQLAIQCKRY